MKLVDGGQGTHILYALKTKRVFSLVICFRTHMTHSKATWRNISKIASGVLVDRGGLNIPLDRSFSAGVNLFNDILPAQFFPTKIPIE
jgi:hypothetical protein